MRKKMRKFSEGGFTPEQDKWLGGADRTDPYILARMRSAHPDAPASAKETSDDYDPYGATKQETSFDLDPYGAAGKSSVVKPKSVVSTPAAPKVDMDAERKRMEELTQKQGLIKVHPEDYFNPAGALKAVLRKTVGMAAKRAETAAANSAAKNATRRAEEGLNPSEALEKLKPTRNVSVNGKEIPVRQGTPSFNKSSEGMGVKDVTNKSGQKIPVKRSMDDMIDDGGAGAFKRGGKVSKTDMKKAGFYDKGKTKSERQKIVSKVTTKPQRIAIVEKAFSTKNMKAGGMASRRADGCAIRGKTRA
jgi:hypothetical protein